MIDKLRNCFDEMVVYKDLKKSNFFSSLSLPSFMRDWLLKRFQDENGHFDADEMVRFVRTYLPRKDDWISIKNQVVIEHERVKFLAKVSVDIDIKTGEVSFSLPDFGLVAKDTSLKPTNITVTSKKWHNEAALPVGAFGNIWLVIGLAIIPQP